MSTIKINTIQPVTSGDNLVIRTGAGDAEQMRITSAGSVGIGTSNPLAVLDVKNSSNTLKASIGHSNGINTLNFIQGGGDYMAIGYNLLHTGTSNNSWKFAGADKASLLRWHNGGFQFWGTATPGSAGANASLLHLMAISSNGEVGIGTGSPSYRLHVGGSSHNDPLIFVDNGSDGDNQTAGGCMGLRIRAGDGTGTATLLDVQNISGVTTHFAVRKDYLVQNNLPMFPCRAWVTFNTLRNTNGAIDTSTTNRQIFGSGNVTSVSRGLSAANGAANLRFRVTFTEPMPNANYAVIGTATQYLNSNSTGSLVCLHTTANGTAGSGQGPGEGAPSNKTASSFDIIIVATATATTSGYDNHYVSLVVFG